MGSTKDEIKINKAILNLLNISRHTVKSIVVHWWNHSGNLSSNCNVIILRCQIVRSGYKISSENIYICIKNRSYLQIYKMSWCIPTNWGK